jgi:hypothetical protein
MTYWNMRAYSDGGKMRPKASRAEVGSSTQAARPGGGSVRVGDLTAIGEGR